MFNQARSLQFVWFLPGDPPSSTELFNALLGSEPDGFQKINPPHAPIPVTVVHVVRDELVHKLQSHYGRVDYFVEPIGNAQELPLVSNPALHIDETLERIPGVSNLVGDIVRAALVITLAKPMDTVEQAGEAFTNVFSGKFDFTQARDLSFQMSRRLAGTSVGDVNRLLRWWSDTISFMPMVANSFSPMILQNATERHYMNFMVDVNTVPSPKTQFSPSEHLSVFKELATIARELMSVETVEGVK